MRPPAPWSGSIHKNCTTKAVAELRRPVLRVPGKQQHAVVQQSHQQKWQQAQQAGDLRTLQADISQAWIDPHCAAAGQPETRAPDSCMLAHLAETNAADANQQQRRRRRNTAAGMSLQHGSHQHTQQQQPQDMNPSDLAAAFLKLLKQQQQAAAAQQQANCIRSIRSSGSSSPLTSKMSNPYPVTAMSAVHWDEQYYQQLLQHTQLLLPQLQPRQASLILYTAAKLGRPPGQQLLAALLQQRLQEPQLQQLPPAGLTNVLWALAVMQHCPGQQWMAGFYAACSSNGSTSTSTSTSSRSSGSSPSTSSSSSSSSSITCLNRHQLCSLLWSLGSLQERPPAEWLQQLLAALRPHLQDLQPSELTNVLWGLAQLGYRPSKGWAKEWFSASSRVLDLQGSASARAAGVVKGSFGDHGQESRLQHSAEHGRQQQQQQREQTSQHDPTFSADHLACIAGSLGLLRLDPRSGHWLRSFRHYLVQQLPSMRGAHVATILCGLAKRRSSQPPHWVWLLVARQLQLLEMQQQQQQQRVVLQQQHAGLPAAAAPVAGQAAAAEADAATQLHTGAPASTAPANYTATQQLQPADIAATVWALPRLLYPTAALWNPSAAHSATLKVLAAASLPLLPSCSDAELVQLAVGFAGLRFYPGAHWLKVHENAVAAQYNGMSPANRVRLRAAVRVMWSDG